MRLTLALCVLLSSAFALADEAHRVEIGGETHYTGYLPFPKGAGRPVLGAWPLLAPGDLPERYDAREAGMDIPIRNQGSCGSCWAFARTRVLEAARLKAGRPIVDLAEQDTLVNDKTAYGCDGGFMDGRFEVEKGVTTEALCPYKARDSVLCSGAKEQKALRWAMLPGVPTDDQLRSALVQYGMLAVTVAAGGSFEPDANGRITRCGSTSVNHMVVLSGYQPAPGGGWEYLIDNSWGTGWGLDGRAWSKKGCNKLASTSGDAALFFVVESVEPPPPPPPPPPPAGCELLPVETRSHKGVEVALQVRADVPGRKCRWSTGERGCRIWVKPDARATYTLEVKDLGKDAVSCSTVVAPE